MTSCPMAFLVVNEVISSIFRLVEVTVIPATLVKVVPLLVLLCAEPCAEPKAVSVEV